MEKWKGADEFPLECQVGMKAERDGPDREGPPELFNFVPESQTQNLVSTAAVPR